MAKTDERNYPFSYLDGFNYAGQYDAYSFSNSVFYIGSGETAYGYIDPNSFTTDIDYYRLGDPLLGNLNAGLHRISWDTSSFGANWDFSTYSSDTPSDISIFVDGILYNNINVKFNTSGNYDFFIPKKQLKIMIQL